MICQEGYNREKTWPSKKHFARGLVGNEMETKMETEIKGERIMAVRDNQYGHNASTPSTPIFNGERTMAVTDNKYGHSTPTPSSTQSTQSPSTQNRVRLRPPIVGHGVS